MRENKNFRIKKKLNVNQGSFLTQRVATLNEINDFMFLPAFSGFLLCV